MRIGRVLRHINYLNILLIISGIQPVFDQRVNGSKFSKIGVLCVLVHIVLCIYSDQELEREQRIMRFFVNGIMLGMKYLHRFANLFYPIVCVVGAIVQFEILAKFVDLNDRFDIFLAKSSMNVKRVHLKIRKMQHWSCIIAFVIAGVGNASNIAYTKLFAEIGFHTYYTGIFFGLNFTLVLFKISNYFYAFYLRMQLFSEYLEAVLKRDLQPIRVYQVKRY